MKLTLHHKTFTRLTALLAVSLTLVSQSVQAKGDLPGVGAQPATYFYTGKPYDADLGSYTFAYRTYNPDAARWLTTDASGFPDSANSYRYITNNPFMWLDPTGLSGTLVIYSISEGTNSSSTSGHSWISYTPDGGTATTYGTWGNNPGDTGNGLHTNLEAGIAADTSRTSHLNDSQEQNLNDTIEDYTNRGSGAWSYTNPCSGFASNAWHAATGEALRDGWPISTPTTLKASIYHANGDKNQGILE